MIDAIQKINYHGLFTASSTFCKSILVFLSLIFKLHIFALRLEADSCFILLFFLKITPIILEVLHRVCILINIFP